MRFQNQECVLVGLYQLFATYKSDYSKFITSTYQKEGSHYDLPIALCLLVALKILPESILDEFVAFGELTLNGRILPCKGVLLAAMSAQSIKKAYMLKKSAADVALLGVQVIGAQTL